MTLAMRLLRLTIVGSVFLTSNVFTAAAVADTSRLCFIPVPLAPNKVYSPGYTPLIMQVRTFPGSRWPIFRTWGASSLLLVLNEQDQLEIPHGFPIDLYDYVTEPSGRVVGFWSGGTPAQLYIQDQATGRFVGLEGTDKETIGVVLTARWISSRRATLIGTSTGLFSLAADDPIPEVRRLELNGGVIGHVSWINDLPSHQAAAIGTDGHQAFILNADNRVNEVLGFQIPPRNYSTRFSEIDHPDRLLIQTNEELWTAPLRREGDATIPDQAHRITRYVFDGNVLQYYPAVHRYLVYAKVNRWFSPSPALLRLQDELAPIDGSTGLDHPFIRNIPSRGIVSIETFSSGIYTYDGTSALKPVAGSTKAEIGEYPKVYDLVGQHRVIVVATRGLYELTAEGHLNRLPLPPELEGATFNQLAEIPESHLAVIFADRGAFELDPAGRLLRIRGADGVGFGITDVDTVTLIPVRETLFVSTYHGGSFMILDSEKAGEAACAVAR
jgi:hypothetical protein